MNEDTSLGMEWFHANFELIVTGRGERQFLPKLFSDLLRSGMCSFDIILRIDKQLQNLLWRKTPPKHTVEAPVYEFAT